MTTISTATLNVNGHDSPIKRRRLIECIKTQNSSLFCLEETYLSSNDRDCLRVKEWTENCNQMGPGIIIIGIAILYLTKQTSS